MIEKIKARILDIEKTMQDLVTQHTVLAGHLAEAKHLLEMAEKYQEENLLAECSELVHNPVNEVFAD